MWLAVMKTYDCECRNQCECCQDWNEWSWISISVAAHNTFWIEGHMVWESSVSDLVSFGDTEFCMCAWYCNWSTSKFRCRSLVWPQSIPVSAIANWQMRRIQILSVWNQVLLGCNCDSTCQRFDNWHHWSASYVRRPCSVPTDVSISWPILLWPQSTLAGWGDFAKFFFKMQRISRNGHFIVESAEDIKFLLLNVTAQTAKNIQNPENPVNAQDVHVDVSDHHIRKKAGWFRGQTEWFVEWRTFVVLWTLKL